ncbi:MAG: nucleotide exchange factor GrpE [Nitrososphaerota archaeon]|jgi:molecular chaperone GrpE|uniref:nucleotide exchange factor GrpE n=1 Tax=Candidatus Bathycorpusculum sp. TaxID=2994959 RepID=UPI002837A8CE|nr:nucleotide exchange factor GrpE [Candidatus Termiticorpusculum sp.]MCL2256923.1 nucleotide exchange factor GrpE [Candidatus Termiticorpusculum sp.]MCL2292953.1 nucleotide exchange factor GrpE [Candidatus Termiticorpusculum sp.]MDR0461585.1 nucleotide exchange factor GrpE [Nitrososphaerota archaeon]
MDGNKKENKKLNLKELYEAEKCRSEELVNRLKYAQADYENLKRRSDRDIEQIKSYSNERLVTQLLDTVDELELAITTGKNVENSQKVLLDGVEMTLKKLRKVLEQEGVTETTCSEGKIFDPASANAVLTEERSDYEDCTILQVIRKGYVMKGHVIRPSIVKVSVKSKLKTEELK